MTMEVGGSWKTSAQCFQFGLISAGKEGLHPIGVIQAPCLFFVFHSGKFSLQLSD